MNMSGRKVVISEVLSPDLALRFNADAFFDYLDSLPENHWIIDFCNVRTITRSFAQEYKSRKAKTRKTIFEINVPTNVRKMFDIVETVFEKTRLLDLKKGKPITLTM